MEIIQGPNWYKLLGFMILAGAKIETSLPLLLPLQNAAPHEQSKQNLKPLPWISESVECLVCIELRRLMSKYIYRLQAV